MISTSRRLNRICATLAGAAIYALSTGHLIAEEGSDWQEIVTEDAWLQYECRVAYLSHIVERQTESGRIVMVKVHCDDKRSFDAVQSGIEQPFKFSECTPRETKSC